MFAPRIRALCAVLVAAVLNSGCWLWAHSSSPWEYGGGVRLAPGFPAGTQGVTLHPVAGATFLSFDGGHDELFELGGQVRKKVAPVSGFWVGAEATGGVLRTKYSSDYQVPAGEYAASLRQTSSTRAETASNSNSGWSLSALVGVPVGDSKWGMNLSAAAGITNYGSSGKTVRVGIDFQPWFLKR